MVRLRILLAWLLVAAVPLQGLAATSLLLCAAAGHLVANPPSAASASGPHHHAFDQHANDAPGQALDKKSSGLHSCGLGAACCHDLALTQFPSVQAAISAPPLEPTDAIVRIASRSPPLPEKPPRA